MTKQRVPTATPAPLFVQALPADTFPCRRRWSFKSIFNSAERVCGATPPADLGGTMQALPHFDPGRSIECSA
jgi:hypothetical protein